MMMMMKQIKNAVETQKFEYIEIPNPIDLKFGPVVAAPLYPTRRLCKTIGIFIQPILNFKKKLY